MITKPRKTTTRRTTTTTTQKPTTLAPVQDLTSKNCCRNLLIDNHGISGVNDPLPLNMDDNFDDESHFQNKNSGLTLKFLNTPNNFWAFGREYDYTKSLCYVMNKNFIQNPCVENLDVSFR